MSRLSKTGIGLSIDMKRLDEIDKLRGDIPRSKFIQRIINMMFENHKEEIIKYVEDNKIGF